MEWIWNNLKRIWITCDKFFCTLWTVGNYCAFLSIVWKLVIVQLEYRKNNLIFIHFEISVCFRVLPKQFAHDRNEMQIHEQIFSSLSVGKMKKFTSWGEWAMWSHYAVMTNCYLNIGSSNPALVKTSRRRRATVYHVRIENHTKASEKEMMKLKERSASKKKVSWIFINKMC